MRVAAAEHGERREGVEAARGVAEARRAGAATRRADGGAEPHLEGPERRRAGAGDHGARVAGEQAPLEAARSRRGRRGERPADRRAARRARGVVEVLLAAARRGGDPACRGAPACRASEARALPRSAGASPRCIRARRCATASARASASGTSSSAACEGVAARASAARSVRVTSISWPDGAHHRHAARPRPARTSASSLKAARSSAEPPPRPRMIASTSGTRPSSASARAMRSGGVRPLHRRAREQDAHGPAAERDLDDVVDRRAVAARDDADHARLGGQRPLALGREEPLGRELLLEPLERLEQRPAARRARGLRGELEPAPRRVHRGAADDDDPRAVGEQAPRPRGRASGT